MSRPCLLSLLLYSAATSHDYTLVRAIKVGCNQHSCAAPNLPLVHGRIKSCDCEHYPYMHLSAMDCYSFPISKNSGKVDCTPSNRYETCCPASKFESDCTVMAS
ncbi:hypothetical protein CALVIDRAFT_540778 [Calocera viscosa TUFC12733]|uniref:Uncharacterized protein n=1 Tax=Calocera viscosa (strain TUFC12733) TaxID=1330018 RepID=A0A167IJE7_CALVF|nr:hypothetical protein CALVIDRAFT_540778 [Calocera viscosa TUFC12733]